MKYIELKVAANKAKNICHLNYRGTPNMNISSKLYLTLLLIFTIGTISCNKVTTGNTAEIDESLEPIEAVVPVESGENVSLTVNRNADKAYFDLKFENIQSNSIISNGEWNGWCIDVFKPLNSNGGVYNNVELFSTDLVEQWLPVNYLLNIQDELLANDEDLTWREIQLAIWSLRAYPAFNLDDVAITELPSSFHEDGEPLFSYEKVENILPLVESGYQEFDYTQSGTKYAVVAALPVDVQTVFAVVEKN